MSAIADSSRSSNASGANLRAYLAGGGASTALVAAAVLGFLTIAALVAFNGLPFAGGDGSDKARVAGATDGAPEAAAAAAAAAPGAVAASAAAPGPLAPAPGAAGPGTAGQGGGPGSSTGAPTSPPAGGAPPANAPGSPATPVDGGGGTLGQTVGNVEQTAGSIGVDLPLTETTQGVTAPVDQALGGALNEVGGTVGSPGLGDRVDSTVKDVTGKLP